MRRVAQKRDAAEIPAINRIAVDHWVFKDKLGLFEELRHVEPIEFRIGVVTDEVFKASAAAPIVFLAHVHEDFGRPVEQLRAVGNSRNG